MARILFLFVLIYGALPVLPGWSAQTVTYIEFKYRHDQIKPGSFEATTRKLWRVGKKYARVQEAPDPVLRIHGLMIVNAPNTYMINLYTMQAQHIVDPGPSIDVLVPVFGGEKDPRLKKLQMGHEFEFFSGEETRVQLNVSVEGARYDRYTRHFDDTELSMLAMAGTRTPFLMSLKRPKLEYAVQYLKFETGGPADLSLFEVPVGVKLHRAKQ
jgi:hypothetical protein